LGYLLDPGNGGAATGKIGIKLFDVVDSTLHSITFWRTDGPAGAKDREIGPYGVP
jgi:hypothetical protein